MHRYTAIIERCPETKLYVIEKIQRGVQAAEQHGEITQEEAEQRLAKWSTE